MSVTINAHQLGRLLARTADHIGDDLTPALHGIRLDADAEYLYAVATDRYTIAAARYRHHRPDSEDAAPTAPFAHTIPAPALPALREWIRTVPGHAPVTVTPDGTRLRFTAPDGELTLTTDPGTEFIDWRGLLRGITEQAPITGEPVFPALGTRLQARWQTADAVVRIHATGNHQPLLVIGEDFLGAQMPTRARRDGFSTGTDTDTLATPADVRTAWHDVLSASPATTPQTALPVPPQSPCAAPKTISEVTEDLLKQVLHSTQLLIAADTGEAMAAHATAGATAWAAYRYLDALHTADPHLAATVTAETADQLDDGAISEWAWDAAAAAGHDPHKWQTEAEQRSARRSLPQPVNT
ncbi:hypothetical protein ACFC34_38180 [Streptomyces sp. NPDC056053]|uniref:hypothetical protein n=1 Tax=Streptomyces sp. NPDC056053 TaxID=3345696 RepID=UPI0035DA6CD8